MDRTKIADLFFEVRPPAQPAGSWTALHWRKGVHAPRAPGSLRTPKETFPLTHAHRHTRTHTQCLYFLKICSNISAWNHTVASTHKMADKNNLAVGLHSLSTFSSEYLDWWSSRKRRFSVLILLGWGEFCPRARHNCSLHLTPDLY